MSKYPTRDQKPQTIGMEYAAFSSLPELDEETGAWNQGEAGSLLGGFDPPDVPEWFGELAPGQMVEVEDSAVPAGIGGDAATEEDEDED